MTFTKYAGHWADENGNRAYFKYFGGEAKAKAALESLKNCVGCINCLNCTNCEYSIGCVDWRAALAR